MSFSENQKEILIRVARTLKSHRKEIDQAWETRAPNPAKAVILLRKRHLNRFIDRISAGDFQGWEDDLHQTAERLRQEQISLSLGHSLHFCGTAGCLDLLMKEFPRKQQWVSVLLALECFHDRNLALVIQGYGRGGDPEYGRPDGRGGGESRKVSLTPREREVLDLVVKGLISKEIAGRLGISVKTVEVHRANLMKKLGMSNVAQLVSWAYHNTNKDAANP